MGLTHMHMKCSVGGGQGLLVGEKTRLQKGGQLVHYHRDEEDMNHHTGLQK